MPEGQKRDDYFLVAYRQASVTFYAVKKPLDFVAVLVLLLVEKGRLGAVGNYHLNPFFSAIIPVFIAVIARVGDNLARHEAGQQRFSLRAVPGLAAGDQQAHPRCPAHRCRRSFWCSFHPGCGPNTQSRCRFFGRRRTGEPAPRSSRASPSPSRALSTPRTQPHTRLFCQATKTAAYGITLAKTFGQVRPRRTGSQHPHHSIEKQTVVRGRNAAVHGLARQQRRDGGPLPIRYSIAMGKCFHPF